MHSYSTKQHETARNRSILYDNSAHVPTWKKVPTFILLLLVMHLASMHMSCRMTESLKKTRPLRVHLRLWNRSLKGWTKVSFGSLGYSYWAVLEVNWLWVGGVRVLLFILRFALFVKLVGFWYSVWFQFRIFHYYPVLLYHTVNRNVIPWSYFLCKWLIWTSKLYHT